MKSKTIFITAIDTSVGKTYYTGLLAKYLKSQGINVITQKFVQTGCDGISDDIIEHRRLMGESLNEFDKDGTTCPYVFKYPASPHLAAELEGKIIDTEIIFNSTKKLEESFDLVLLEGAGGLMVPINENTTILDYIEEKRYPLILVTNAKLGSINHTLLSIETIRYRNMKLLALAFNYFNSESELILENSKKLFRNYMKVNFPSSLFIEFKGEIVEDENQLLKTVL